MFFQLDILDTERLLHTAYHAKLILTEICTANYVVDICHYAMF